MSLSAKPGIASSIAFCVGCGLQTSAQARFCNSCGTPLLIAPTRPSAQSQLYPPARPNPPVRRSQPYPPARPKSAFPQPSAPARHSMRGQPYAPGWRRTSSSPPGSPKTDRLDADVGFDLAEALVFPFRERGWFGKLCMLAVVAVLPFFSIILLRGWRLEIARRIGRSRYPFLPSWSHIGGFFARGLLLWFMTGLYAIPQVILFAITGMSKLKILSDIFQWVVQTFILRNSVTSFQDVLTSIGFSILGIFAVPALCALLSYPFYRVGMIRYTLTGRAGAFFALGSNWNLALRHLHSILALFFFEFLVNSLFTFATGLFLSTGIGALLIPVVLLPISYWMTGHLFGTVALQMRADILAFERRTRARW